MSDLSDSSTIPQPATPNFSDDCVVRFTPAVANIPTYVPGKNIEGYSKISSNENPSAPSDAVLVAAREALTSANRYPDMAAHDLRSSIAAHLSVSPDQVCVGSGSSGVLHAALNSVCVPGAEVVFPWRSFESYPIVTPLVGATSVPIPLTDNGRHDLLAMTQAVNSATAAVILCSPNNPTGPALSFADISAFAQQIPSHILLLIDEAYIEFATDPHVTSALPLIKKHPNMLILRTFSKAYALAGLRVGYGVGHKHLIETISSALLPFGVSNIAQKAAIAALADNLNVKNSVEQITRRRSELIRSLRNAGYDIPDSQANFIWIPARQAGSSFLHACDNARLVVRVFPEGVRISIGTEDETHRFLQAALSVL